MIGLLRRLARRSAATCVPTALALAVFGAPAYATHPPEARLILAVDQAGNAVQGYGLDGTPLHTFTRVSDPPGIGVARNGDFAVPEPANGVLKLNDRNGNPIRTIGAMLNNPADAAFSLDGSSIFVPEAGGNKVQQFSVTGPHIQTISGPFDTPIRAEVGPNNQLYVGQHAGNVLQFDLNNGAGFVGTISGPSSGTVSGVDVNQAGDRLFTTDLQNHRVQVFRTGDRSFQYGFGQFGSNPGDLFFPSGLALADGRVYVGSGAVDLINAFDENGNFLFRFPAQNPLDLALQPPAPTCRADLEMRSVGLFTNGPLREIRPVAVLDFSDPSTSYYVKATYHNNGPDPVQHVQVTADYVAEDGGFMHLFTDNRDAFGNAGDRPFDVDNTEESFGGLKTESAPGAGFVFSRNGAIDASVKSDDCIDPDPLNNTLRVPVIVGKAPRSRLGDVPRTANTPGELVVAVQGVFIPKAASTAAASPRDVTKVELALVRTEGGAKAAARKPRCLWLKNAKPRFKGIEPEGGRCRTPIWVRAKKVKKNRWSLKLPRGIPAGSYALYARATNRLGAVESAFSAKRGNRRAFKVRKK